MDKQRLRFNINDEIILLEEILCEKPFHYPVKWNFIQTKVNGATSKSFSIRSLRDHLQHLMRYGKEDIVNRKKSGTEEEYNKLKELLQEIIDMYTEFSQNNKKRKFRKLDNNGVCGREESAATIDLNRENESPLAVTDILNVSFSTTDDSLRVNTPVISDEVNMSCNTDSHLSSESCSPSNHSNVSLLNNRTKKTSMSNFTIDQQQEDEIMRRAELELQMKKILLEEAALEITKKKLRLEEERLKFKRHKFETETKERDIRLKLEIEERQERLQEERDQRQMLLSLIQLVVEKNKS